MKKVIRREVLRKRDEIPPEARSVKNALIKQRFFSLPEFIEAKTVLFYASFRSEVETLSIIRESLNMNKRVVVPKVDKERHRLRLYEIKDASELTAGFMGIPEPSLSEERLINIDKIDLIVLPGSAFDYSGNRLGYGGGYYDILLSEMHKKIPVAALAYEEQLVDSIPSEMHDIKVNMIVTDKSVIRT
ncbi:MAG: 5-formyltetrahydrofolate cyclo-ligase [Nitrospirae bacterium]|jgi:5-formyltetrahydrofolate cyclo-ligase|nr:5-formyltetrahydrofolate cyclo-ligase [Nitrospirota bacterium]